MRQDRSMQKYKGVKRVYNELYQLYTVKGDSWSVPEAVITEDSNSIALYAPESFEYLLLKSDNMPHTAFVTEETFRFADSKEYFSWEEFYTSYLIRKTENTIYQYSKKKLKETYLTAGSRKRIMSQLPETLQAMKRE
ncbi:MAG: hypothetical protein Q4C73_05880 [Eubacteriales bacterium]|nr:hypothetical protein [Eubacteriales bacterium]